MISMESLGPPRNSKEPQTLMNPKELKITQRNSKDSLRTPRNPNEL